MVDYYTNLPIELLYLVASQLDLENLSKLSGTCRLCKSIHHSADFWRYKLESEHLLSNLNNLTWRQLIKIYLHIKKGGQPYEITAINNFRKLGNCNNVIAIATNICSREAIFIDTLGRINFVEHNWTKISQPQLSEFFIKFSHGLNHLVLLTITDEIYVYGCNRTGQLGLGNYRDVSVVTKLTDGVKDISCGNSHTAYITGDGELYMCGYNQQGQLGDGTDENRSSPVKIHIPDRVIHVSCGAYHTSCLTIGGQIYIFGENRAGQLGMSQDINQSYLPVLISGLPTNVKIIACGRLQTAIVTQDGKIYVWGYNGLGQLATGDYYDYRIPKMIQEHTDKIVDVVCSDYSTLLLDAADNIYMTGVIDFYAETYNTLQQIPHQYKIKSIFSGNRISGFII